MNTCIHLFVTVFITYLDTFKAKINGIVVLDVLVGTAASKGGAGKEASGAKKEKKKQDKPPAEKKEKKEAEPAEEMDAADALLAAEPKSKDPFDELPKG